MDLRLDLSNIHNYNSDYTDYSFENDIDVLTEKNLTKEKYGEINCNNMAKHKNVQNMANTIPIGSGIIVNPNLTPLEIALQTIRGLYDEYDDDPYMFPKMHNYICYQLPNILNTMKKTHMEKQQRVEELTAEQNLFIQSFMNMHQYFYCQSTEMFFKYDGINYTVAKEDNILYHILSTISREKQLMSWKQRTKVYILKRIKDENIMKSIPESGTIQSVLDAIYPAIFETKADAKYFLTLVGDTIFRKNGDKIYFINGDAKHFIRELSNACVLLFGINIGNSLKLKYYEHNYENSRLVRIRKEIRENIWLPIIQSYAINIFVVACHYSIRYDNADQYASEYSNDEQLINYSFYLKNKSQEEIVQNFATKYFQVCHETAEKYLSWENIRYLWKQYLEQLGLPNIMFQNTLKTLLSSMYTYNETNDTFINITSDYLPSIQHFLSFWRETIIYDNDEYGLNEYEIDELCGLYRKWCVIKKLSYHHFVIGDKQMVDYITFYFPQTEIEQEKYVYKIRCSLWDKQMDVQMSLEQLQQQLLSVNELGGNGVCSPSSSSSGLLKCVLQNAPNKSSNENLYEYELSKNTVQEQNLIASNISVYDAYAWYCTNMGQQQKQVKPMLVSKSYFEKCLVAQPDLFHNL